MRDYELEMLFRVYDMTETVGVAIEVKPHPDMPEDYILISTESKEAEEFYGKIRLTLHKKQARLLAQAILKLTEIN